MARIVIKEGKTVELAIENCMKDLGVTSRDDVKIEIIDEGAKGFLGFGSKMAKVSVALKPDNKKNAINFLKEVTLAIGIICEITAEQKDKNIHIEIKGENVASLIGKRGYTLDSLQYLTNLAVNKGEGTYSNVIIDIENYRERRKETLENLGKNLGKKALRTKKPVVLEPMSAYERRIIHMCLQNDSRLKTTSEGKEPYRYVVITAV